MSRLFLVLLYALAFLYSSTANTDPWEEYRPFWGERPGKEAVFCRVEHNNQQIDVHLFRGADAWAQAQIRRFSCVRQEPNSIDRLFIDKSCTVWRSLERYDLEGTHHQAVQPTFIDLGHGEWIFYLYDFYTQESLDAIPPPCRVLRRRVDNSVNLSSPAAKA